MKDIYKKNRFRKDLYYKNNKGLFKINFKLKSKEYSYHSSNNNNCKYYHAGI